MTLNSLSVSLSNYPKCDFTLGECKRVAHAGKISGMNDIVLAKEALRKKILFNRKNLLLSEIDKAMLLENLLATVERVKPKRVATYLSYPSEPDTAAFIKTLTDRAMPVLVPDTLPDGILSWHEVHSVESLKLSSGDLLLLPALAIDRSGNRLGRGKGYFDREVEQLSGVVVYGVIFDAELLAMVPSEAHDQKVHGVVTPEQILYLN